jgi:hypothetical protein
MNPQAAAYIKKELTRPWTMAISMDGIENLVRGGLGGGLWIT